MAGVQPAARRWLPARNLDVLVRKDRQPIFSTAIGREKKRNYKIGFVNVSGVLCEEE